ncbi:MAG: FAD-binding protein [Bdellovibrionales bacterium]|nr:FAD-binding protein [Bdellovibrionales bacterium]
MQPEQINPDTLQILRSLRPQIEGELKLNTLYRMLYAQDASIYRETPLGVVFPKTKADLRRIVLTAAEHNIPLIPRGGGTSLAGQVVGKGLVVDIGRHMNQILEINPEEHWVRVQPGVIRDDLNRALSSHGLMFAPETSTSSRCMVGGMVANNSCGANSIQYGDVRRHLLEGEFLFADGTIERLGAWEGSQIEAALSRDDVLGAGAKAVDTAIRNHRKAIEENYPPPNIIRRNNGYPLDILATRDPYTPGGAPYSLAEFMCGTEGTLAILTEAKLNIVPKPKAKALVCAHFTSIDEALRATQIAVKHSPSAVEIVDRRTLELAKLNPEQDKNRFFLEGDPAAIIAIQFEGETRESCVQQLEVVTAELRSQQFGFAYPLIESGKEESVWELRREGLGIVMGQPGDIKPETSIEDAAVGVDVLPQYIGEVLDILGKYDTQAMVYGHVSVGVVHLRPELNLKDPRDKDKFLHISAEVHQLVKKYRGSLSGEHGDGRIRSPYLSEFLGAELMNCHAEIKRAFDPRGILNPGKIVNPIAVDQNWRVETGRPTPEVPTYFNWSKTQGLVRAVEKCNGVGACRKTAASGGTMCPSYMATLDEKDSTRGRANVFQNLFYSSTRPTDAFGSEELHEALDLCLSCKGCKRECPSSVDMARMKAEFLQGYYEKKGTPLSALFFGHYPLLAKLGSYTPSISNRAAKLPFARSVLQRLFKVSPQRQLPPFANRSFSSWFNSRQTNSANDPAKRVMLYIDPFTNYSEPHLGQAAVRLLEAAGYRPELLPIDDDGRTLISKGLLRKSKALMDRNARKIESLLSQNSELPVVGIEPSALLTFRDEMPDLVSSAHRTAAQALAKNAFLIDEFVAQNAPRFEPLFKKAGKNVVLHGHCHQKAIAGTSATCTALQTAGYSVEVLKTGCCGMAGSFGYEHDHYDLSMQIAELTLFPALRKHTADELIAAPGTSCRHQIRDGLGKVARHPVELIADALQSVD